MPIHLGTHLTSSFFHEKCSGEGTACYDSWHVVLIPTWKTERLAWCRRASFANAKRRNENHKEWLKNYDKDNFMLAHYLCKRKLVHSSGVLAKELHPCLVDAVKGTQLIKYDDGKPFDALEVLGVKRQLMKWVVGEEF